MSERLWRELATEANAHGLKLVDRGNGHWQITGGPLLVNYYPFSKQQSAYVAGTSRAEHYCTAKQAVAMAFVPPPLTTHPAKRKSYRKTKERMFKRRRHCQWCHVELTLETATIDHVIPLSRGGLDNDNNRVLACAKCNHDRGNSMPEITQEAKQS